MQVLSSRPPRRAVKAEWVEYAVRCGVARDTALLLTKPQLWAVAPPEPVRVTDAAGRARVLGPVEAGVHRELSASRLVDTAHGAAALKGARHVDEAVSGAEFAAAARELRLTLAQARSVGNPLSPRPAVSGEPATTSKGTTVVPPSRLERLREESARGPAKKGQRRAR